MGSGNSIIVTEFHHSLLSQGALILVIVLMLLVAWNGLRSLQYRRAAERGDSLSSFRLYRSYRPARSEMGPEPYARRVLRVGFGLLWIVDGLLQLQSNMPIGVPGAVLQPSVAGSPGWVQRVAGFAATTWSNHPAQAAASVVWIELGIGLWLLVAPRGRWSRAAAVVSVGWGLTVWIFGEAFGGIFAPGLSIMSGAPGAVLFYVVAGVVVALPDRAWATEELGRTVLGSLGIFFLVMAGLQAWPGRGSWQGTASGHPGTLAATVHTLAGSSQPRPLASLLSSFASFDQAHGWVVNLFVVVVLAAIGLALVWGGKLIRPALAALVVLAVADWVLVQDMGIWGGTGTNTGSMVPLVLVAVGGYLALVRAPETAAAAASLVAPAADVGATPVPVTGDVAPGAEPPSARRRRPWDRLDPVYARRAAAALGAMAIVVVGVAPMAAAAANPDADPLLTQTVNGPPTVIDDPAPAFHLVDQHGQPVTLADLRGYTVALTFLDPVCTTDCPSIAREFSVTNQMLGSSAAKVRFVAIVTNPFYISVGVVAAFDRQEGLQSQSNWLYLTGSRAALQDLWNDFGVVAAITPAGGMVTHSDVAFVIDPDGVTRRAISADPGDGQADGSSFTALLADEITQVMRT
jgi:cytochrome oxidase Cu insertion factor (SCO1/SenC/PrrC family)